MREFQDILKRIARLDGNEQAVLATVVDVQGSGYRRPGAKMLIDSVGLATGMISGGCLEMDVSRRAKTVMATGEPTLLTYDTIRNDDSVFGLTMGCSGVIQILLERVGPKDAWFTFSTEMITHRKAFSRATVLPNPALRPETGRRLIAEKDGPFLSDLNEACTQELLSFVGSTSGEAFVGLADFSFGKTFVEGIMPSLTIKVFGAGNDALPLIRLSKELGWHVCVVDPRSAFASPGRLFDADEIYVSDVHDLDDAFFGDENSVAVVMTHNFARDCEILPRLLKSDLPYVGILGPKKRTARILTAACIEVGADGLEKLYAPIGMDIGADSPEAIAISIVAEIQAVLKKRPGGFLRDRIGAING